MQKPKKFILYIFANLILIVLLFFVNSLPILNGAKYYEAYMDSYSSGNVLVLDGKNLIMPLNRKGECYTFSKFNFDVDGLIKSLQIKIMFTEEDSGGVSIYGYSSKIKYKKHINGKKINVHIRLNLETVKVGFPIIYGSF